MAHRSRSIGAGAIALATGILIALPAFSGGATVKNDLRSFAPAQTRVGPSDPPRTKPPLHGTNPHGQGTAAVVDISPNPARPFVVDERGNASDEDIIIGRSRGEQRPDGTYRGHVTVAAAFGSELIARSTGPGEKIGEANDPVGIADDLLDDLCDGTNICLDVAEVYSETTATGSFNSFSLASATLGGAAGVPALSIGAAQSTGNITTGVDCQTATGGSRVADVRASVAPVVQVAQSANQSIACRLGNAVQTASSSVAELDGDPVPLLGADCANNVPDTQIDVIGVLTIVCNADDSSSTTPAGNQASAPYGVRNALDVYVLAVLGTPLAQVSTAQSESRAVAPAAVTTTTPTTTTPAPTATTPAPTATTPAPTATTPAPVPTPTPGTADDGDDGDDGAGNEGAGDDGGAGDGTPECSDGVDNDGDGKIDFGSDPGCSSADDDSEANAVSLAGNELPFTGTDVVVLGLAGSILLAAGLTLRGPARRREFDEA